MKKNRQIAIILLATTLLLYIKTQAQVAIVSTQVSKDTITIGDTLTFSLKLKNLDPEKSNITFPTFQDTITSSVHIIKENNKIDTLSANKNLVILRKTYVISSYDSGQIIIPQLPFILKVDTVLDTIYSPIQSFFVKLVPIDTLKVPLKDIKKPLGAPITLKEIIDRFGTYILASVLLLIIIYLLIRYFRRKKEGKAFIEFKKTQEPPHVIALKKLEELKNKKLWQHGKVKQYHIELSNIFREYIENQLKINALEQTSSEIIHSLKKTDKIDGSLIKDIEKMLEISDLAKFAKYQPLPDENDYAWKKVYEFVITTMPKEEPENEKKKVENNQPKNSDENDKIND